MIAEVEEEIEVEDISLVNIVSEPDWFPVSINAEHHEITFINVDKKRLAGSAFHDGRTVIRRSPHSVSVDMEEIITCTERASVPLRPLRIVGHTSFCGSTLLSRLLSLDDTCFTYREPQVLVELTDLKAQHHQLTHSKEMWQGLVEFVFGQFSLPWADGQDMAIKPANWTNGLLDDLLTRPADRIVTMSSSIDSYLLANLRGGDASIRYSLNLLNSLISQVDRVSARVNKIEGRPLSPFGNVLHLLTLCLLAQESVLKGVYARFEGSVHLTKDQLQHLMRASKKPCCKTLRKIKPAVFPKTGRRSTANGG
ncbi:MAG: hypothetical protein ACI9VI_001666 [Candidatus Azotimanducaceae bacterium]|jgi:hypothetical protein